MRELACCVIRILGEKKRINDIPSKYPRTDSFPMDVRSLVKHVYHLSSKKDINEHLDNLRELLRNYGIIDRQITVLTGEGLSFIKANVGSKYWICPRCKTVHLHRANGICMNCLHVLDKEYVLTEDDVKNPND